MDTQKLRKRLRKTQGDIEKAKFGKNDALILLASLDDGQDESEVHAIRGRNIEVFALILTAIQVILDGYDDDHDARDGIKKIMLAAIEAL
ncbi:hypothetical protein [Megasphaera massiliensis]|uniref:hypothetical protein n=1 Tax=Megasphaera massiliensis TaxID=1232428 RepID=UPI000421986A|nr:hypothetical protein [Megasphaera massiliensis]